MKLIYLLRRWFRKPEILGIEFIPNAIFLHLLTLSLFFSVLYLYRKGEVFLDLLLLFNLLNVSKSCWCSWPHPKMWFCAFFSPTRTYAYYNKRKRFNTSLQAESQIKHRKLEWTKANKVWNTGCLIASGMIFITFAFCFDNVSLSEFYILSDSYIIIGIGLLGYWAFSRILEIIIAFTSDAKDRLSNTSASTNLSPYERLTLMLKSYIELSFNYASIYFFTACFISSCLFKNHEKSLEKISDLYFYSVGVMTSLGTGNMEAVHLSTKIITVFEATSSLILLVLVLAVYVSSAQNINTQKR